MKKERELIVLKSFIRQMPTILTRILIDSLDHKISNNNFIVLAFYVNFELFSCKFDKSKKLFVEIAGMKDQIDLI